MRVHLFPSAGPISSSHFLKTITNYKKNCKTENLIKFIDDSNLKNTLKDKSYAYWGVTNGVKDRNKNLWMKMEKNDIGLFYKNKTFFTSCLVHSKFNNEELALHLWDKKFNEKLGDHGDYETWENIFLLKEFKEIELSIETYNEIYGHTSGNIIRGYTCLEDEKAELLLDAVNLIDVSSRDSKTNISLSSRSSVAEHTSVSLVKHTDGNVLTTSTVRVEREIEIDQKEMKLIKRYKNFLKKRNEGPLLRNRILPVGESSEQETDGWIESSRTLIEAKASSSRPNVRMAIGQLLDYKRHIEPEPKNLAILLPSYPRKDLVDLIFSQNIQIIYEKDGNFYNQKKNV